MAAERARYVENVCPKAWAPYVVPGGWYKVDATATMGPNVRAYASHRGLRVIFSAELYTDASIWLHISTSREDRLPSWFDMRLVKDIFVGPKRTAISVLPSEEEYVNRHPFVLHLWSPVTSSCPLPDFRRDDGTGALGI